MVSIVDLVQKVVGLKASSKELRSNDVSTDIRFDEHRTPLPRGNQQCGAVFDRKGIEWGSGQQPTAPDYHEVFTEKCFVDKSIQTNQPLPQKPWSAMSPQERREQQQQRRQDATRRSDEIH